MNQQQFFRHLEQAGLGLNQQQKQAVMHLQGPLQVIAGPGSGKTRVIIARTVALLAAGIAPSQILILTFTKAAAREMKQRLAELPLLSSQMVRPIQIGTFHALCYQVLKAKNEPVRIVSAKQQRRWIEESLLRQEEEVKADLVDELLQTIGRDKNRLLTYQDAPNKTTLAWQVWVDYENMKAESGLLDFDDMLLDTHQLLLDLPALLQSLRRQWPYIMVDEFQDTSLVQYELLRLLAAPENNLCVVGDVDQAIYAWRAADPRILLRFGQDFPHTKRIELLQNYRSTPPIINLANRLIAHNKLRYPVAILPQRQGGTAPRITRPEDEWDEAASVLQQIQQLHGQGWPLQELAVLYRTNNQARPLVSRLVAADIPFKVRERDKLGLDHWVIKECHAFLRLLHDPNHTEAFLRVGRRQLKLNQAGSQKLHLIIHEQRMAPGQAYRQLPQADASKLTQLQKHIDKANKLSPERALLYYLYQMGFASYLEWYAARRGYPEDHFLSYCDDLLPDLRRFSSVDLYLQHIDEMLAAVNQESGAAQQPDAVNLMTLHGAKGLEFQAVWIVGVIDGFLPHALCNSAAQREEERRLLYVGCTRAKDFLHLLAPQAYRDKQAKISPYLLEILEEKATQPKQAPTDAQKTAATEKTWPPPSPGQHLEHVDLGPGKVVSFQKTNSQGPPAHVVVVDFPARAGFKLHWELSLQMGFIKMVD